MGRTSPGCESAPCVQYMYSIIDHPTKCVSKENQTRETKTAVLAESVLGTAGDSHPVDLCIRCAPEAVASRRARAPPPPRRVAARQPCSSAFARARALCNAVAPRAPRSGAAARCRLDAWWRSWRLRRATLPRAFRVEAMRCATRWRSQRSRGSPCPLFPAPSRLCANPNPPPLLSPTRTPARPPASSPLLLSGRGHHRHHTIANTTTPQKVHPQLHRGQYGVDGGHRQAHVGAPRERSRDGRQETRAQAPREECV